MEGSRESCNVTAPALLFQQQLGWLEKPHNLQYARHTPLPTLASAEKLKNNSNMKMFLSRSH